MKFAISVHVAHELFNVMVVPGLRKVGECFGGDGCSHVLDEVQLCLSVGGALFGWLLARL